MLTLREALLAARRELEGLEEPLSEAELLLALALGESRLFVRTRLDRELPLEAAARLERFVALRKKRCPYAYIAGRKAFMDYDLEVSPAVLIPRPETELLAE
ncbi:MAG: protein-(glutamine-N5) methyltransferase, release factor-specific, partial [Abditibacteriota bacterium]|nr:protein-(glutamine-N5) methyltransferase, release factor-specific [Abditibacteriota bacterium]